MAKGEDDHGTDEDEDEDRNDDDDDIELSGVKISI